MQYFQYLEMADDSVANRRQRERDAIAHSIELLTAASTSGLRSRESIEALFYTNRLWAAFAEDLASEENANADEFKAKLISIALWFIGEARKIQDGQAASFVPMIEVSRTIYVA
jgi:flagellar protein FlaF